jgi:serine/threonine protein phosphatase PrpC
MRIVAHGRTDVGRERDKNEDAMLIDKRLGVFVVCDGIGGHAAGEVAADLAVRSIRKSVAQAVSAHEEMRKGDASHDRLRKVAEGAMHEACSEVYEAATSNLEYSGMGCTPTLLVVSGNRGAMAHVGDTSLFLCRDEETEKLNISHTYEAELMRRGVITRADADKSRYANTLSRSVGAQEVVECDKLILDVVPGDTFLLCSDGLTRYLEGENELTSYLRREAIQGIPQELVDLANFRGGNDNITAVVVRAEATEVEREEAVHVGWFVMAKLNAIRWVPLFEGISLANRIRLANTGEVRMCKRGDVIVKKGQSLSQMCIVLQGEFAVLEGGKAVRRLRAGDSVGEETLFAARPWSRPLHALEDGQMLIIGGGRFRELARLRPWLGVELLSRLGRMLSAEHVSAEQ